MYVPGNTFCLIHPNLVTYNQNVCRLSYFEKSRLECSQSLQQSVHACHTNTGPHVQVDMFNRFSSETWSDTEPDQAAEPEGSDPRQAEEGQLDSVTRNMEANNPEQVSEYQEYVNSLNIKFNEFVAGVVSLKLENWKKYTSNPEILDLVKGIKLEFIEPPVQDRLLHETKFSKEEEILVRKELENLEKLGIVEQSKIEPGDWVSNIFARPKKDKNKVRILLNLKSLNKKVRYTHFKMGGVQEVLDIIRPGSYMVTIDFTHGFYSLKVHPSSEKYLKAVCLGKTWVFKMLPMGYSRSPLHFCKLLKVPLTFLRTQFGYTNSAFVDDVILVEDTFQEARDSSIVSADTFQDLGYTINVPKSELYPEQRKVHQGLILDSVEMTVSLTQDKIDKLIRSTTDIMQAKKFTIRQLASVVGQMNAARFTLRYGPLHTKSLEIVKNIALKENQEDFDAKLDQNCLSALDRMDLQWWIDHAPGAKNSIQLPPYDHVIYTDASNEGYGFYHEQSKTRSGGRWSQQEATLHINTKEIRALHLSLIALFKDERDLHIKVHCDSQVAIACIRKQGSVRSFPCNTATRNLLLMCEKQNFILSLTYICSEDNDIADFESRHFHNDDTEWSLNADVFQQLSEHFRVRPDIDLFASRLNHKVPQFCSWKPEPGAAFIDAFTVNWQDFECIYLFPSFSMMGRVVRHLIQLQHSRQNVTVLILFPVWPSQVWYTKVLSFLIANPVILRVTNSLLTLEHNRNIFHPMSGGLRLMAGLLSSNSMKQEAFRSQCQRLYAQPGLIQPTSNTLVTLPSGKYIACKKVLIPVTHW